MATSLIPKEIEILGILHGAVQLPKTDDLASPDTKTTNNHHLADRLQSVISQRTYVLPPSEKMLGVSPDQLPLTEAAALIPSITSVQLTSYQDRGFKVTRSTDGEFRGVFANQVGNVGSLFLGGATAFELLLDQLGSNYKSNGIYFRAISLLDNCFVGELKKKGFKGARQFVSDSSNEIDRVMIAHFPNKDSLVISIPIYRMPERTDIHSKTEAVFIISTSHGSSETLQKFIETHGSRGMSAIFALLLSPEITESETNSELVERQRYTICSRSIAATNTVLLSKSIEM